MAKNIEPKLKKIGDYLKLEEDTVFTIPEYQRAYSWGIDNCDKLWQDINDFVESESKDRYFFGTIIINCQDNDTKYGLIDGQQRTTTFLLLLKALLVRINTPGLRRYFTEVNKMPITDPIGMCSDMVKLVKVWKKVSEYPQMKVLLKFNENTKLFLASYFFRFDEDNITEELVEPILECLLRLFSLLELIDVGYSSKYFKTFLFGAEVKLVSKSTTVDAITQDFNEHIRSNWDKETIWAALHDYDGNVLVYLNEFLFAKEKGLSFTLGTKYDIEHIMPYSGNNLQEIRKDAEIDSEEEFYGVVNKLGNKILLEEKINRAIGNEWFRTKVSTKLENKTGYIDSKYPIARALVSKYQSANKPYWKKDDIMSTTDKASDRIVSFIFGE